MCDSPVYDGRMTVVDRKVLMDMHIDNVLVENYKISSKRAMKTYNGSTEVHSQMLFMWTDVADAPYL